MGELRFREVKAEEIDVKYEVYNENAIVLTLYKNARVDQNILDEAVGPLNWQKRYSRENKNCIVSIWDDEKKQWIEKEDTGVSSEIGDFEKGLASDSFKRACFVWGIGRALYSAKNLKLMLTQKELGEFADLKNKKVYLTFTVLDIEYKNGEIENLTIGGSQKGTVKLKKYFSKTEKPKLQIAEANTQKRSEKNESSEYPEVIPDSRLFSDDETILIGDCTGKKYGEVKDTPEFKKLLIWTTQNYRTYETEAKKDQYRRMRMLASTL